MMFSTKLMYHMMVFQKIPNFAVGREFTVKWDLHYKDMFQLLGTKTTKLGFGIVIWNNI